MSDHPSNRNLHCERCGVQRRQTLVASRVAKMTESGHYNFFRCDSCGHISNREIPQEPPKK